MRVSAVALVFVPLAVAAMPVHAQDSTAAAARPATGRIAGTVEISLALASRRAQFRIYADPRQSSTPRTDADELRTEIRNVVVYMQDHERLRVANATPPVAVMSQVGERFEPHVVPILQGGSVEFPNGDDVYHNVFSLSRAKNFDLGRYPKGASRSVVFNRAGVVQVSCHIHADMSGIVLVLPNAFYATPENTGRYVIENVPPGEYHIVGWHERTRPVIARVRVVAGETTTMNFRLPLSASDQ